MKHLMLSQIKGLLGGNVINISSKAPEEMSKIDIDDSW